MSPQRNSKYRRRVGFDWILAATLGFLASGGVFAQTVVVLPAAAALDGASPFSSDVRVFNASHTDAVTVTATYRCFVGACPAAPPGFSLSLAPRESVALDDICGSGFGAPNTAGAVEFSFEGDPSQVIVTSRLFSSIPSGTVGMFIPGLESSQASSDTVLTSVRTAGTGLAFRANVGVFNPGDAAVTADLAVFDGSTPAGNPIEREIPAHSGVQLNQIFDQAGVPDLATGNGVVTVHSTGPVFSYAVVIDNATSDPYFVIGATDPPAHPPATIPPTSTATRTPTPTPAQRTSTPTPTPVPNMVTVQSSGYFLPPTITVHRGDTVEWVWATGGPSRSTTSGTCSNCGGICQGELIRKKCSGNGAWASGAHIFPFHFSHRFDVTGTFHYFGGPPGVCACPLQPMGTVIVVP